MKLTNEKIYTYAQNLMSTFVGTDVVLPVKVNFYLQKNKKILTELAQDIEEARMEIAKKYGELSENGSQYVVADDKIEEANKELVDLFELEQEVQIYTVSIDSFKDDMALSTSQMEALMFMID